MDVDQAEIADASRGTSFPRQMQDAQFPVLYENPQFDQQNGRVFDMSVLDLVCSDLPMPTTLRKCCHTELWKAEEHPYPSNPQMFSNILRERLPRIQKTFFFHSPHQQAYAEDLSVNIPRHQVASYGEAWIKGPSHGFDHLSPFNDVGQYECGLASHSTSNFSSPEPSFFGEYANSLLESDISPPASSPTSNDNNQPGGRWVDAGEGCEIYEETHAPQLMVSEHCKYDRVGLSPIIYAAPTSAPLNEAWAETSKSIPAQKQGSEGGSGTMLNRTNQYHSISRMMETACSTQYHVMPPSPGDKQDEISIDDTSDLPEHISAQGPVTMAQAGYESQEYPVKIEPASDPQLSQISSWNAQTALAMHGNGHEPADTRLQLSYPDVPPTQGPNAAFATDQDSRQTSTTLVRSAGRNLQRDQLLIQYRDMGMPYNRIKELLGFTIKLSTLRGRYRSLTKPRSQRVRKPVWTQNDARIPFLKTSGLKKVLTILAGPTSPRRCQYLASEMPIRFCEEGQEALFSYCS